MDFKAVSNQVLTFIKQTFLNLTGGKGIQSKRGVILLLWAWWAFYAIFREKGWLMKKSLTGKHIYLTGAGSGLGRSMAIRFAKMGAKLSIIDINEAGLEETKNLITKAGGKSDNVLSKVVDVSNREQVAQSAEESRNKFGDVDVLINNAGIVQGKPILDSNEKLISKVMLVNAECHFWFIKEFLPAMVKR